MPSLPTVGGDNNNWGTELNEYLSVDHDADGTHKVPFEVEVGGPMLPLRRTSSARPPLLWLSAEPTPTRGRGISTS